ncbi:MAG TPA: TolC family protein, partial [Niastella sp.]
MKHNQSLRTFAQRLVLLVAGVSVLSLAKAQTAPLSLKQALQQALKNKAVAVKAKLDVENGQNKIDEARSQALPQVSVNSGLTYNPILQLSALPGELTGQPGKTTMVAFGQKWNSNTSLSLSQTLFDQSVFTGLKAAKTTQQYYKLLAGLTDEQVIEQVATQYYQVLVQRQQLVVVDSNIATTTRVKNVIEGQYKNGLAKKIDLDRSKVNLSNLDAQRQRLINSVQLQENTLKFYMGIPIETPITIPSSVLDSIQPKLAMMD